MSVAQSRSAGVVDSLVPPIAAGPLREAEKPAAARLADDLAVPAPSPVHRLQAGLAQLTTPGEAVAEGLYPGWFRLTFPMVTSALLWGAILWGVGVFA
jgi:hypothetical protein